MAKPESRNYTLTFFSVALLALGIGAFSAGNSILSSYLFSPIQYSDASRLIRVWGSEPQQRQTGALSFLDIRELHGAANLSSIFGFAGHTSTLKPLQGDPLQLDTASFEHTAFSTLGVSPSSGRAFGPEEDLKGASKVCLLRQSLWQRLFGGTVFEPGKTVNVDGVLRTVIGIMPNRFRFPSPTTEIWFPAHTGPYEHNVDTPWESFTAIAQLKEGIDATVANQEIETIMHNIYEARASDRQRTAWVESLSESFLRYVRGPLKLLGAGLALVFFVSIFNVAILQIIHVVTESKKASIRFALGASPKDFASSAIRRSATLSVLAVILSLPLAQLFKHIVLEYSSLGRSGLEVPSVPGVLLLSGAVGFLALLAISLWSLRWLKDPFDGLRSKTPPRLKPWRRIATGQVAIAFVLLTATAFFLIHYQALAKVSPGFDPENLYLTEIRTPNERFPLDARDQATWAFDHRFARQVLDDLRRSPDMAQTTLGMAYPTTPAWRARYSVPGVPPTPGRPPEIVFRAVADQYFEVTGIPILAGRDFQKEDVLGNTPVAVINEAAAKHLFPNTDPIGKLIRIGDFERQIVGVVGNVHFYGIERDPPRAVYVSYFQTPAGFFFLTSRTTLSKNAMRASIRASVDRVAPDILVPEMELISSEISSTLDLAASSAVLSLALSLTVLILTLLGLYALMTASVISWRKEISVRLSVGSGPQKILWLILLRASKIVMLGLLVGVVLTVGLQFLLQSSLPEGSMIHTYVISAILCFLLCTGACLGPAWRSLRIEPAQVLRSA